MPCGVWEGWSCHVIKVHLPNHTKFDRETRGNLQCHEVLQLGKVGVILCLQEQWSRYWAVADRGS